MIDHVQFSDMGSNKITKRVGFSFGYLFLGPFYLIGRLRFEGLILLVIYYLMLPIPGIIEFCDYMASSNWNKDVVNVLTSILMFFRSGWDKLQPYICILMIVILHIYLSFKVDNFILRVEIKKKNYHPISETDARKLIYYGICKYDVKLYKDIVSSDQFNQMVENDWKNKNLNYTMMIDKNEINKQSNSKNRHSRKKRLYTTSTTDLSIPYQKKENTNDKLEKEKIHQRNLELYKNKKITRREYEILEEKISSK